MAWYTLGCAYDDMHRTEDAFAAYLKAKKLFPTTANRYYSLCEQNIGKCYLGRNMNNGTYTLTAEQIADIVRDIRTTFGDVAHDIKKSSTKVNNDEVLFCLLSCLRLPTSVMARCLHVTDSTLRGRKTRLKAKMPEELYNVFFGKR